MLHKPTTPTFHQPKGKRFKLASVLLAALLPAAASDAFAARISLAQLQAEIERVSNEVIQLQSFVGELSLGQVPFPVVQIDNKDSPSQVLFGAPPPVGGLPLCRIGIDPAGPPGLLFEDPFGIRVLNPDASGPNSLTFGPTDECRIFVDPNGPRGLMLADPNGIRLINPNEAQASTLLFGPSDECRIRSGNPNDPSMNGFGMIFTDPNAFLFENPAAGASALVVIAGTIQAQEFVQSSSRALKDNVIPIEDALDRIARLDGVYFDWKDSGGDNDGNVGFIAEDVVKVLPEAVAMETDGTSPRGVKYGNIVALAVEGIKDQQSQIDALRQENAELRQTLAELKAQIGMLAVQGSVRH